jgi:hypothetical protein
MSDTLNLVFSDLIAQLSNSSEGDGKKGVADELSKRRPDATFGGAQSKETDGEITSTLHNGDQKTAKASTPMMGANFLKSSGGGNKGQLSSPLEWMMDFQVDDEEIRSLDFAERRNDNEKVNDHDRDLDLQPRPAAMRKHDGAKCKKRLAFQTPNASANSKRLKEQASKVLVPPHSPDQVSEAERPASGSIQHQQEKREKRDRSGGSDEVGADQKIFKSWAHTAQEVVHKESNNSPSSSPKEMSHERKHSVTRDQPPVREDSQLLSTEDEALKDGKEDRNQTDNGNIASDNGHILGSLSNDNLSEEVKNANEKGSSEERPLPSECYASRHTKSDIDVSNGLKEVTGEMFDDAKGEKINQSLSSKEGQVRKAVPAVPLLTNSHSNANAISILGAGKEDMSIVATAPKHFKTVSLSNAVDLKPIDTSIVPAGNANIASEILETIPKQMEGITETCSKIDAQNAHISKLKEHAEKVQENARSAIWSVSKLHATTISSTSKMFQRMLPLQVQRQIRNNQMCFLMDRRLQILLAETRGALDSFTKP